MQQHDSAPAAIILYQTEDGYTTLDVRLQEETVWLSLTQMAELFDRDKSVISRHLRNIFRERELVRAAVVAKNATTAADGKTYQVEFFNLDAIISVGLPGQLQAQHPVLHLGLVGAQGEGKQKR